MSIDKCKHCCAPRSEEFPMTYICGSEFGGHTRSKMCEYTENAIYKERADYDKMCEKKDDEIYELQKQVANLPKIFGEFYQEGIESLTSGMSFGERIKHFKRLCEKHITVDLPSELVKEQK